MAFVRWAAVIAAVGVLAACQAPEDPARAAFRARLKQEARLTPDELRRLVAEAAQVVGDKPLKVSNGGIVQVADKDQRLAILAVLADPSAAYEADVRKDGTTVLRGVASNITPAFAEIDTIQTLWIDADTLLPRRYEVTHSVSGFDDSAYDLIVE
jgi:hypothetical protein